MGEDLDLRRALLTARDEARDRVVEFDAVTRELAASRTDSDADDEHDPEGSTVSWERAVAAASLDAARDHLRDVEAALARVGAGWDGACAGCGRSIPVARLAVRPQTDRCVSCAAKT